VPKQPDSQPGRVYRGRRRLPKLPSRRYATVVLTAMMAASVVAFGSSAVLPDDPTGAGREDLLSVSDPFDSADRANREQDQGVPVSVDGYASDVWLLPVRSNYQITSEFGYRSWAGRPHFGTDLALPGGALYGAQVYSVHKGLVEVSGGDPSSGYGYYVLINHGDGVRIWYAHLSRRDVVTGQTVKAGTLIGRVGSTGFSTGAHLHFEIRVNDVVWDAEQFMRDHGVDLRTRQEEANGGVVS
jgi:murein DD-endopeptidase MepM/ murein hydrolase activator NlpD